MTEDQDKLSFPQVDYDDAKLREIWRWIRDELAEQGRVYNHNIVEKHGECPTSHSKETLERDLLKKLRDSLVDKEIIEVRLEEAEDDDEKTGAVRKLWIIKEEGDSQ